MFFRTGNSPDNHGYHGAICDRDGRVSHSKHLMVCEDVRVRLPTPKKICDSVRGVVRQRRVAAARKRQRTGDRVRGGGRAQKR
jgi:hypothetical protein